MLLSRLSRALVVMMGLSLTTGIACAQSLKDSANQGIQDRMNLGQGILSDPKAKGVGTTTLGQVEGLLAREPYNGKNGYPRIALLALSLPTGTMQIGMWSKLELPAGTPNCAQFAARIWTSETTAYDAYPLNICFSDYPAQLRTDDLMFWVRRPNVLWDNSGATRSFGPLPPENRFPNDFAGRISVTNLETYIFAHLFRRLGLDWRTLDDGRVWFVGTGTLKEFRASSPTDKKAADTRSSAIEVDDFLMDWKKYVGKRVQVRSNPSCGGTACLLHSAGLTGFDDSKLPQADRKRLRTCTTGCVAVGTYTVATPKFGTDPALVAESITFLN